MKFYEYLKAYKIIYECFKNLMHFMNAKVLLIPLKNVRITYYEKIKDILSILNKPGFPALTGIVIQYLAASCSWCCLLLIMAILPLKMIKIKTLNAMASGN